MKRGHATCTIVARNYIAQARVLARSFAEHNPSADFYTLIVDGDNRDRRLTGLGTVVLPKDLPIDPDTLDSMHVMYDVMEYATALKPAMLMYLHHTGARSASYFDPDIRVYAPLDDIFETAAREGLYLTPHTLNPIPHDKKRLTSSEIMHAGMYNLGFIATGPHAFRFLTWWHDRLKTDAVVDLANALFTDQRWIDWAPAIQTPYISRDQGLNAAYWNLHDREITRTPDGEWRAGSWPLRFFHFSGYDPATPWILSKHLGETPRTLLSEHPPLRALCDSYGAELIELGHVKLRTNPYRNSATPDGLKLTPQVRRLFRDAWMGNDKLLGTPPNPMRTPAKFREWLLNPDLAAGVTALSRYDYSIWRLRIDLQRAFPEPFGADAESFRSWLDHDPGAASMRQALGTDAEDSTARTPQRVAAPEVAEWGWNVAGYARAELGVGEAARRLAQVVRHTGLPWEMVGITSGPLSRQDHRYRGQVADRLHYPNTVLCVNADQVVAAATRLGLDRSAGRRIGYWFWELATFPTTYDAAFALLDEVWVSTEFNRAAIAERTDKPVRVVPMPIGGSWDNTRLQRRHFHLPEDKTLFLVNFDYLSVMKRKNPLGAIDAYKAAFGPMDGACLVVKSINGHLQPKERERVRLAAEGRDDIILRDEYLAAHEVRALIELADCIVSLHRSEGFGLNLADAMAAGTPVVATAYSGNMDFMTAETSYLIPYDLVEVGPGAYPYDKNAAWADPHVNAAAAAMRAVADSPADAAQIATAARTHIERFSADRLAHALTGLLLPVRPTQAASARGAL